MSKSVEKRIVEMRFDNQQFEKGVQTTMGTLDKLKHSLKLDGATKGLEDVDKAVKGINISGLSSAVETVKSRFSALEVVAITALANITTPERSSWIHLLLNRFIRDLRSMNSKWGPCKLSWQVRGRISRQ